MLCEIQAVSEQEDPTPPLDLERARFSKYKHIGSLAESRSMLLKGTQIGVAGSLKCFKRTYCIFMTGGFEAVQAFTTRVIRQRHYHLGSVSNSRMPKRQGCSEMLNRYRVGWSCRLSWDH